MLCHLLLISIVLSTYAFLSCVHSMFHLFIQVCLSYIFISYMTFMVIYYTISYVLYSCIVIMYYVHVLISYTVFLFYFSYYFLFHINFSDHFTFLYIFIYHVGLYNLMLQNLSSHSNAMLLISYHIFSHVIFKSFVLCFMHVNTKEVDTGNYKGPKALYSLYETVVY